jgi:DNA-directed RNA polymerase subunit RPC12/RpoP
MAKSTEKQKIGAKKPANTNCLQGFKCPQCGNTDSFKIEATCMATVFDDGVDTTTEFEWNNDSYCECPQCSRTGIVQDFSEERGLLNPPKKPTTPGRPQ